MRLSVTDLEAFRRFRESEDMPLHVLLAQLRRQTAPSAAMEAGAALHSILETAEAGQSLDVVKVPGYTFRFACDDEITIAPVRELAGAKSYLIDGVTVSLRGRVDALPGNGVEDHKLTARAFDALKYAESYQWRAYLSIFNAEWFAYNVFVGAELSADEHGALWEIREFHRLPLFRYPGLEADLVREIGRYVEFAREHMPETVNVAA